MEDGSIQSYIFKYCKMCVNLDMKQWRDKNPDKVKNKNSSIGVKASKQKWLDNNREKRQAWLNEYNERPEVIARAEARRQTPEYKEKRRLNKKNESLIILFSRLRENISNSILKALKKGKSNKAGQSILQFLGYTINDLKQHLEKLFDSNMNWDNYGKYWHLDHKAPQSDLPYSSMEDLNFKECWKLKNLRPLEAKQNMSDGGTRVRHKKAI
jgi:hypothetical protein